jgi:site-specific DNA-methyltransferase (adenine-specific)
MSGKIFNTDCINVLKKIPDKSIQLILQDPPYKLTFCKWDIDILGKIDEFWIEWKRVIKNNGTIL